MDHRIKLYIEKTGILLAVYLLLKYLLPLVFPFFLAWLTVSLLASASRHFHRKLLPFTASVVAMFFFFTAATLKLTGWLLLEPCKDLIPELQGRFPIVVKLNALTTDDYERILTAPQNAITKQYAALLETDNIRIEFKQEALRAVAEAAFHANETGENIGARRLHTIIENLLEDISFNATGDHPMIDVVIDEKYVSERISRNNADDMNRYII